MTQLWGRSVAATTWTKVNLTRLPRQHEMRDASTPGVAETPESDVPQACAATPSRSRCGSKRPHVARGYRLSPTI